MIGRTSTCVTVAIDSRYPHSEPAGKWSPKSETSQFWRVLDAPLESVHALSPLRVKFVFASADAMSLK